MIGQQVIVKQDRNTVGTQMNVCFDAGNPGVQGSFKRGQGVFRFEAAGAAVALEFQGVFVNHGEVLIKSLCLIKIYCLI